MEDHKEDIESIYRGLSPRGKETIRMYAKLIAVGEANARNADSHKKEEKNATAR